MSDKINFHKLENGEKLVVFERVFNHFAKILESIPDGMISGMPEYKRSVIRNFLLKQAKRYES